MNTQKAAMTDQRNYFVDLLKGICICFVIITHFSWTGRERLVLGFPFWIDMAVPIFMVISGYVNALSFEKKNAFSFGKAYSVREILPKIMRYTIPFAAAWLLERIVLLFGSGWHSLSEIVMSFVRGGYGPGSYYYPVMMQLVFLFPIIYFVVKKHRGKGIALCGAANFIYEFLRIAYYVNDDCNRLLIFRYIFLISCGCGIALEIGKDHRIMYAAAALAGAGYLFLVSYTAYSPVIFTFWTTTSMICAFYIAPVCGLLLKRFGSISAKGIQKIVMIPGKASYHIFLVQMVWYWALELVGSQIESRAMALLTDIAVCIAGGIIFYYVESPVNKRLAALVRKKWAGMNYEI